jgi:uncharacterized protein YciI
MRSFKSALLLMAASLMLGACCTAPVAESPRTWFIFLETGRKTPNDKEAVMAMQRGHIDNFKRLFGEKKLSAAGPLRDPSTLKRGIVVVQARSREELTSYFQPDQYVREGYMTLNATPAVARRGLNTEGIDPNGVEEGRIILISRPASALPDDHEKAGTDFLQSLIDKGTVGAWYRFDSGPIADILFAASKDTVALEQAFATHPAIVAKDSTLSIWGQWLSRGVIPSR